MKAKDTARKVDSYTLSDDQLNTVIGGLNFGPSVPWYIRPAPFSDAKQTKAADSTPKNPVAHG